MRALDIAIFMWILQMSLFIVGSVFGGVTVTQPKPLITADDIQHILVAGGGEDPAAIASRLIMMFILPLAATAITARLMGLNAGATLMMVIGLSIGLFMLGRSIYYALNLGSLTNALLKGVTNGYLSLPPELVWGLNAVTWVVTFIALMDWWRGMSSRQVG